MKLEAVKYLRPLKFIIDKSGANYKQVATLVDLKLLLDNRKKLPNSRGKTNDPRNSIFRQALGYIIVGVFLSLMLFATNDHYLFIFSIQTMLMVLNTVTLLAEYSVSLFDTRDNNLLLPLPANGQTIGWARVIHIMLYLLLLSFSLAIAPIIISAIKFDAGTAILFTASVLLNTCFTLFFTVFLYLLLIKVTSGEKLKDIMMYIQVSFTILMVLAYQIVPRLIMPAMGEERIMFTTWYYLFIPPAWFTSFSTIIIQRDALNIAIAIVGLVVPITAISLIGNKLFYGFDDNLIKLDYKAPGKEVNIKKVDKVSWWVKISAFLMGATGNEYPIYRLMWKLSGRERLFKQSILPVLAYVVIIPVMSVFFGQDGMGDIQNRYLIFLYFTVMSSSMIPTMLTVGNNKNAEWIYSTLPNLEPHHLFKGALKATLIKFFLPVYLLVALPLIYFKGAIGVLDILTIFIFNYMLATVLTYWQTPYLMFTQERANSQGGKTGLKMIAIIVISMPLGFLHSYLSSQSSLWILLMLVVFASILIVLNKFLMTQKFRWSYVNWVNKQF